MMSKRQRKVMKKQLRVEEDPPSIETNYFDSIEYDINFPQALACSTKLPKPSNWYKTAPQVVDETPTVWTESTPEVDVRGKATSIINEMINKCEDENVLLEVLHIVKVMDSCHEEVTNTVRADDYSSVFVNCSFDLRTLSRLDKYDENAVVDDERVEQVNEANMQECEIEYTKNFANKAENKRLVDESMKFENSQKSVCQNYMAPQDLNGYKIKYEVRTPLDCSITKNYKNQMK